MMTRPSVRALAEWRTLLGAIATKPARNVHMDLGCSANFFPNCLVNADPVNWDRSEASVRERHFAGTGRNNKADRADSSTLI